VQRLPVIGQTFTHSAFESVQRAALEAAGAPIAIERWERRPHELPDAIEELRGPEFAGALILNPHKEKVAALADALSEDAKLTGAVNVIVRDGDRLRGYNSDVDGLRAGLAALLPKVKGKWPRNAVVLGAGGGARAAVAVLVAGAFQHVAVFNRHLHRAESVVSHFSRHTRHMELRARPWHETIMEVEQTVARPSWPRQARPSGSSPGPMPRPRSCDPRSPRSWAQPTASRPWSVTDARQGRAG
jgi:shikimate 5-dehydrogenase